MITRRAFLQGSGALVVAFSLGSRAQEGGARAAAAPGLPGSLKGAPWLDAWIRIGADGSVTVFTGKAELGQGVKTALAQVAAEELDVAFARVALVTADTARTPNEGFTAGSNSLKDSGTALRNAAAQVRARLVALAAQRFGVEPSQVTTADGVAIAGAQRATYAQLVAGLDLHVEAQPASGFKDLARRTIVGTSQARVDIPAKVTGGAAYVHDLRLPGMLHARVVRPPSYDAVLESVDAAGAEKLGARVVRDGSFLAVVAEREWTAVKAQRELAAACRWRESARLPAMSALPQALLAMRPEDVTLVERRGTGAAATTLEATFTRHYQAHGSIGPSCAVAHREGDALTVWSHTQGVFPDRAAIAEMLAMPPEKVRVVHQEGAGCYGHNGADDAAADAALVATLVPGRPVRVQWMREQEHAWEPFGPAMVSKVRASLDGAGRIVDWDYGVWSNTHSTRPGKAGSLLAARHGAKAFRTEPPKPSRSPEGLGDRNAIPLYAIPGLRVVHHFLPEMPVRVSALRGLGAYHNVFSIECFMDELALAAGADPVDFRLRHLEDARAKEVVRLAAAKFGWGGAAPPGLGRGFAFARYKNAAAYCAVAVEVSVDRERGRARLTRVVAAVDAGQVVNPDGLRNQVEGGILQSASWTLYEKVRFDERRIRSVDWSTYPILRFDAVPATLEVHLVDRPAEPWLGAGECAQGPAAAAVGNAVSRAMGRRLRDIPLLA